MTKHLKLSNLNRGLGGVIGIFARNSYLIQSKRWKIIGAQIGNFNVFDTITGSTDTAMDIMLKLSTLDFTFNPGSIDSGADIKKFECTSGDIYQVSFVFSGTIVTTNDFRPVIVSEQDTSIIKLITADKLGIAITLYIKEVSGVISEELNKVCISELTSQHGIDTQKVIPIACSGRPTAKVYYTVTENGPQEDLDFYFEGKESEFLEFKKCILTDDVMFLKTLTKENED